MKSLRELGAHKRRLRHDTKGPTPQRGWPCALHHSLFVDGLLVGETLSACSPAAMGPVTVFVDPGKYQFYSCEQLTGQRTQWTNRELELKLLMDKAEQGTGGTVVNVIAYQTDYVMAREELKVIDATARAKKCDATRRP